MSDLFEHVPTAAQPSIAAEITLQIELPEPEAEALARRLEEAVLAAAQAAGFAGPAEMTLVLADDPYVQELNRTYREVDATTDVLSFVADDEADERFVAAPEEEGHHYLGDVILSYPQAGRQAAGRHAQIDELCLLTIHGTLHLLGYDHAEPEEQAGMWAVQSAALSRLGLANVQPAPMEDSLA